MDSSERADGRGPEEFRPPCKPCEGERQACCTACHATWEGCSMAAPALQRPSHISQSYAPVAACRIRLSGAPCRAGPALSPHLSALAQLKPDLCFSQPLPLPTSLPVPTGSTCVLPSSTMPHLAAAPLPRLLSACMQSSAPRSSAKRKAPRI